MVADFRPDWWFEIDAYPGGLLLAHIRFARFTPRTYRQMWKVWRELVRPNLKRPLFGYNAENGGDTWVKFVTKLGFKRTNILAPNGEYYYGFVNNEHHQ